ncbi:MAG: hypothetical protein HC923_08595 [Myxococcales bacterium]|nr:hypothetical protein [Myxococcales bacterium]
MPEIAPLVPTTATDEATVSTTLSKPRVRSLAVSIAGSIEESTAGHEPEVGRALSQVSRRILSWWIDLRRDVRKGDVLQLVYEVLDGKEPRVDALLYASEKHGKTFAAALYKASDDVFSRYYDREGKQVELQLIDGPLDLYEQITSQLGDGRGHKGVDFKVPVGTPIKAPFDGIVTRRNWSTRSNGSCIELTDRARG